MNHLSVERNLRCRKTSYRWSAPSFVASSSDLRRLRFVPCWGDDGGEGDMAWYSRSSGGYAEDSEKNGDFGTILARLLESFAVVSVIACLPLHVTTACLTLSLDQLRRRGRWHLPDAHEDRNEPERCRTQLIAFPILLR